MKQKILSPFLNVLLLFLAGCFGFPYEPVEQQPMEGFRPVYGSADADEIKVVPARPVKKPGKIYIYGQYLLINEINEGIHVYNNQSMDAPEAIAFIQILGNSDMAVKDGNLYTDHAGSIVALTFEEDFSEVTQTASLPLHDWNYGVPPPGGYFECIEPEKGIVIGWKATELTNYDCYAVD